MKKIDIPKEYLIKEYINENKSYKEIGENLGISAKVVGLRLKEYGIKTRPKKTLEDLTGERFGRLVVIALGRLYRGNTQWVCECDCGNITEVPRHSLVGGLTTSCGCYRTEKMFKGHEDLSSVYWNRIMKGARIRGLKFEVSIEDAWNKFIEQDKKCALSGIDIRIVRDYTRQHHLHTASLDRINNDIGYYPDNIQWVHRDINIMKGKLPQDYFIEICERIAKNGRDKRPIK